MTEFYSEIQGKFPIIDRASALSALQNARLSVATASKRGFSDEEIDDAKVAFRDGWRRSIKRLGITDLPRDPFADDDRRRTMSKTREQKIADIAAELQRFRTIYENGNQHELAAYPATIDGDRELAKRLLDAVEREKPEYPTKESLLAYNRVRNAPALGSHEDGIRAAMLADPIIKTAIVLRDRMQTVSSASLYVRETVRTLYEVVNEAGL